MPSNWLEILLVVVLFIITFQPAYIASRRLPPLWDEIALDEESETYGSFRILSDVHLDDTSSFLIEEWFDGPHKLFRMDVLPEHYSGPGAQNMVYGVKKSFISDGGTQECFYFEPFKCHSLNRDCSSKPQLNNTLHNFGLAELFRRFPKSSTSQYSPLMGGVGSIWLEALNSGVEPVFRPGKDSLPSARLRQGGMSKFEVLRKFDRYTFKSTDKFPYKLEFYFFASGDKNDGSDSDTSSPSDDDSQRPNGLVSIHVIDPDFKTTKMMVRIIELAASIQMPVSVSKGSQMGGKGLFELPLGYGCSRKRSESLGEIHYKPPRNCFHSAMQPHTCYLEADTWLPNDLASDTDIDQWRHHSTSIRIVAGRLLDYSYLTVEERDFAPVQEEPELNLDTLDLDETPTDADAIIEPSADQNKGVAIRRVKRVWDMGHFDDKDVSERQAPVPMYFGLIDHLRKCATVDHAQLNELPNIEFSLILPDDTSQQDKGGAGSNSSTNSGASSSNEQMRTSTRTIGLTLVDHLMMSELFEQLEGYKLVREIAEPWLKYQTIIQERRVDSFEFRDHNGQVAWVGPVSLIREFHYIATTSIDVASIEEPQDPRFNSSQPDVPADALRVKLTIIPYTKQLDRQLGRIQLIMSPGLLVDEAYLHRDLDIEPCFKENLARVGSINSKTTTKMTRRDEMMQQVLLASSSAQHQASFDFRLVYPLETPLPSELNASARSKIYAGFLRNLASISLLSTGESRRLNLLQVTHLSVDIEPELVRLTGTLNEWPESFNYIKHAASRPVPNSNVKVFLREPKPNVELCARSCSHYECPVFLYDAISGLCELLEWTNQLSHKKQQQQLKLEYLGDYRSSAYERKSEAKPGADPRLVLQHISESIQDEMGADDETNELAIELDVGSSTKLVLLPSSLQLGNERWHQDQLMLRGANLAAKMAAASAGKDQGANETSLNFDFASGSSVQDLARSSQLGIELEFGYFARKRKFTLGHSQNREHFPIDEAKHLSEDECKQLCSENDCRSYSYCVYDSSCIISKLSTDNEIREASEDEDFCSLMVIDHLSKFHANTKGLIGSEALARMYSQQSTSLKIMLEFESQRDCANACLEFKDFTCRSLFFCRPQDQIAATGGGGGNCFLFADRHSARIIGAETTQQPTPTQGATDNNNNNCDYYQRSYVADYHQYHGKRLTPASSKQVESIEILVGVGAEDCASECSRLAAGEDDQRASICRAFHVCLGTSADGGGSKPKRGKRQQLMCGLLTEDLNRLRSTGSSDSVTIKAKERLTDGPKCTAFIRIAAGIGGGNSISGGQATDNSSSAAAAHPSGLDLEQTSTASRGGNFIRGVLIILLGLAIGYSLGWLVWR